MDNINNIVALTDAQLALVMAEKVRTQTVTLEESRKQILDTADKFLKWLRDNKQNENRHQTLKTT